MGWPRKGDYRLFQERKDKSFILVCVAERNASGNWDAIGNVHEGPEPSLAGCSTNNSYLSRFTRRVAWSDLPAEWKKAFMRYMNQDADSPFKPEDEPGLHRT
jgi:hypothetical protein